MQREESDLPRSFRKASKKEPDPFKARGTAYRLKAVDDSKLPKLQSRQQVGRQQCLTTWGNCPVANFVNTYGNPL